MKMKLSSLLIHTSPLTARQERTSLLFCWGPGVVVTSQQTDGSRLGTSPRSLLPQLRGSRQGSVQEVRPQEQGVVMLPWGTRGTDRAGWEGSSMVNQKGKGIATQAEESSSPSSVGLGQGLTFSEPHFSFFTVKWQE